MRSSTLVLIAFVSGLLRSTARQPCLRGEQRVCKHQAASQEPKKQHRLRVLPSRETVSVFLGGSRLMRAEGSALSLQREDYSRRLAAPFARDQSPEPGRASPDALESVTN